MARNKRNTPGIIKYPFWQESEGGVCLHQPKGNLGAAGAHLFAKYNLQFVLITAIIYFINSDAKTIV